MHLSVRFSTEKELKQFQDLLYEKSGQGVSFTGLLEAMVSEVTIVTAVHNIKSNKGSKTAGVDRMKMDKYLQMPKEELFQLIQSNISNYKPKPAKRKYIEKANGKKRPLGIPTVLDRIIQECMRLILEPICEARFYPHSYGFRPYRAQKHAIRDIVNVINASVKSKDQPVWAVEGDIKGCFDNINHRLLLKKLWRIGIHDKRVLKIISQMYYDLVESGKRIKALRKKHGLTQEQLAEQLGVAANTIARIETGNRGISIDLAIELVVRFDTTLDYIFLGRE